MVSIQVHVREAAFYSHHNWNSRADINKEETTQDTINIAMKKLCQGYGIEFIDLLFLLIIWTNQHKLFQ